MAFNDIRTLWESNSNLSWASFLELTYQSTAIQALSAKTGGMPAPCQASHQVQDFNSFSIMFLCIISTTSQKIEDLFCPFIFLKFRIVCAGLHLEIAPVFFQSFPKASLKIRTATAIFWNYLGLFRNYGLDHIFCRNKTFFVFQDLKLKLLASV